jgi:hypothetical protein
MAVPAWASTVTFDTNGPVAGGQVTIDSLDPTTGNTLSTLPTNSPAGTVGTVLFQANLGTAKLGGAAVFTNGPGGVCSPNCFTIVASFQEKDAFNSGTGITTFVTPTLGGANQGTFAIYATTTLGNDLTGQGFINGTPILTGSFIQDTTFFGSFAANLAAPTQNLDQFNADNYSGQQTVSGNGSFSVNIAVTSALASWFPDVTVGSTFLFATSESSLPFKTGDPSACFSKDALTAPNAACNSAQSQPGVASVGAVNGGIGSGPNTILASDASVAFQATPAVVPEPATLSLLGFGLIAGAAQLRKRLAKR